MKRDKALLRLTPAWLPLPTPISFSRFGNFLVFGFDFLRSGAAAKYRKSSRANYKLRPGKGKLETGMVHPAKTVKCSCYGDRKAGFLLTSQQEWWQERQKLLDFIEYNSTKLTKRQKYAAKSGQTPHFAANRIVFCFDQI